MEIIISWLSLGVALFFRSPIGECDPKDGPAVEFSDSDRAEVYRRVRRSSIMHREAPIMAAYWDAVTERESHGRASIRHTRGKGENGLGPHALGWIHRAKWPGDWGDMCTPEYSHATARAITRIAFEKYGARSIWEFQAIYAGRMGCVGRSGTCTGRQQDLTAHVCPRMRRRGYSCHAKISASDLGLDIPKEDRKSFVDGWLFR